MVDRDDDLKIGVKSTAVLFGRYDHLAIISLQTSFLVLLIFAGVLFDRGWIYFVSLAIAASFFINQYLATRDKEREACFAAFLNNHRVGMVIFLGIATDYLVLS